ncbi:hypothetical protein ETB97_004966 [Aspergillus alliaceus]|uniref:Xylanolytic transcriptional activator regulatory domain-containing protein n=1 Tax=Petromyces alliaceus TaxID=209559 RepID=A0A8H6E4E3_PETAA|nr:hypothetical protein ETB97_004966 [Aspergillus burnettii]
MAADLIHLSKSDNDLDPLELRILRQRGVFEFPSKEICDELIEIFYTWIAPMVPVVNKHTFLRDYQDPTLTPSALLLNAIFTVSSRFYPTEREKPHAKLSPRTFYTKAKALYDAGYEKDHIILIQSTTLLGLYWDGPEDLTENGMFYWSRIGTALAQAHDMHLSEKAVLQNAPGKGLMKRIWWTLYTRDRAVATAFGRPTHIDLDDCTIEPLTLRDFIEDDMAEPSPDANEHGVFFMQYVKLHHILVQSFWPNTVSKASLDDRISQARQRELALHDWYISRPSEMQWRPSNHRFWPALLYSSYNAVICSFYLSQVPRSSEESRSSAFHAASMIISVLETLNLHGQLRYAPAFIIWHALMSFATLKTQMTVSAPSLLHAIEQKMGENIDLLCMLSNVWPIASAVVELLESAVPQDQFQVYMAVAVNKYRQQATGNKYPTKQASSPSTSFRKPKPKHLLLPRSRVIVRLMGTGVQAHLVPAVDEATPAIDLTATQEVSLEIPPNSEEPPLPEIIDPSLLECNPEVILQSLRESIRARQCYIREEHT